jgi:hypothetical protein
MTHTHPNWMNKRHITYIQTLDEIFWRQIWKAWWKNFLKYFEAIS